MNREIRVRGWDAERKKIITDFQTSSTTYYTSIDEDGLLVIGYYDEGGDWHELRLTQFTGLKDANGKDIYEGDIFCELYNSGNEYGVVVFSKGCFCVKDSDNDMIDLEQLVNMGKTIIGNIYQDSDLIK